MFRTDILTQVEVLLILALVVASVPMVVFAVLAGLNDEDQFVSLVRLHVWLLVNMLDFYLHKIAGSVSGPLYNAS